MANHNFEARPTTSNQRFKKTYGITKSDYVNMFTKQGGCCAICGVCQSEIAKALAVDHNHDTGKVRGLLCKPCNTSLGALKESREIMLAMIKYLDDHEE